MTPSNRPPPPAVWPKQRPGRNDPCPCGSPRKFKRCCMVTFDQAIRERAINTIILRMDPGERKERIRRAVASLKEERGS